MVPIWVIWPTLCFYGQNKTEVLAENYIVLNHQKEINNRKLILDVLKLAFYVDSWWGPAATTGIFIAAAITDWLDGYIARKVSVFAASLRILYCNAVFYLIICTTLFMV